MATQLSSTIKAITEISAEPVARAKERMAAALKRGGTGELVSATEKRLKATSDAGKLQGIADAVDSLIKDWPMLFAPEDRKRLEALRDAAKKKSSGG